MMFLHRWQGGAPLSTGPTSDRRSSGPSRSLNSWKLHARTRDGTAGIFEGIDAIIYPITPPSKKAQPPDAVDAGPPSTAHGRTRDPKCLRGASRVLRQPSAP
ncbi:hypothetical protein G7K_0068-t1 [Saitoella complicata NRRL Y-17804]|uniref:Uncharacterized protein n=1 Tax=Saitoella complicata (strain BCRC 22490 / CBS 7301 / JCM 7358 / NBRC 10748 / NRRL Y-17804) TaxID=698492 RepID=A0A0E9N7N1_SAICN|nr:hypothetical protein G7K_0068-t1 [Saitoella complicata NRRL Y-17804]